MEWTIIFFFLLIYYPSLVLFFVLSYRDFPNTLPYFAQERDVKELEFIMLYEMKKIAGFILYFSLSLGICDLFIYNMVYLYYEPSGYEDGVMIYGHCYVRRYKSYIYCIYLFIMCLGFLIV